MNSQEYIEILENNLMSFKEEDLNFSTRKYCSLY